MLGVCPCIPESKPYPEKNGQQGEGGSYPSTVCWWDLTWSTVSRCGVLGTGGTWTCWNVCRGVPQKSCRGWNTFPMRTGLETWGCSAWKTEGPEETWEWPFSVWRGGYKKEAYRCFSRVWCDRTRGNGFKLKERRFRADIRSFLQ